MSIRLYAQPHTYEIQEILGDSPSSIVYLAKRFDAKLQIYQKLVLKVFKQHKSPFAKLQLESFLKTPRQPHLVKVLAFEHFEKWPALILEYISGLNLRQLLKKEKLSQEEKEHICSEVLLGLEELKKSKLCHGDLSLDNILIDTKGEVLLTDYGMANYANQNLYSTKPFNAPEINSTLKPNFKSDLFSLGVLEKILMNNLDLKHLQELKNEHFIYPNDPLLDLNPKQRNIKKFQSSSICKEILSQKIRRACAFGSPHLTARNLPYFLKPKSRFQLSTKWFLPACMICTLLACFNNLPQLWNTKNKMENTQAIKLSIRTEKWVHVQIAGYAGYAPLTVLIQKPGTYKIKWKTQNGAGEKKINLQPGQNVLLSDSDFTKFHGAFNP